LLNASARTATKRMNDDDRFEPENTSDPRDRAQLLRRLSVLEREVSVLRREIDDDERPASLPTSAFRALTVRIAADVYALPINSIVEIIRYVRLTQVPEVAAGIVGALNLRGSVHAVLDARRRFGLPPSPPRLGSSIVLVTVGKHRIGLLVDRVLEVITLQPEQLDAKGGPLASSSGIAALATLGAHVIQLIHVEALLHAHAMQRVRELIESVPAAPSAVDGDEGR
jgi:purine-binding chemotaxis protein CheW